MHTTTDTNEKVAKFVKDNDTFNQAEWNKIKATIPQDQQADAETQVRAKLSE